MSSKRQITIPAAVVRELGLKPGAKLSVYINGGEIIMNPKPTDWLDYVSGALKGRNIYGSNKKEVDTYIREVREGWDERARIAEGDAYVPADEV